jgi:Fur family ferric uptake transcriptional regulator
VTGAPYTPAASVADLDSAIEVLRQAGCRLSTARRQLLEALFAAEGPASAELLAAATGGLRGTDVPSTYRNLELFERLGIARHLHAGHGPGLYVLAGAGEREYLVCERCGRVETLERARLDGVRESIRAELGFTARFSHFPIMGLCRNCAQALAAGALDSAPNPQGDETASEHSHSEPHAHEHSHGDVTHSHPHNSHEHEHLAHEHEHSHGDRVHSHPHVHQAGLEHIHEHEH